MTDSNYAWHYECDICHNFFERDQIVIWKDKGGQNKCANCVLQTIAQLEVHATPLKELLKRFKGVGSWDD